MFGVTTWILFLGVLIVGCGIAIVSVVLQCLGCCNRTEPQLVPISWHLTQTVPPHGGARRFRAVTMQVTKPQCSNNLLTECLCVVRCRPHRNTHGWHADGAAPAPAAAAAAAAARARCAEAQQDPAAAGAHDTAPALLLPGAHCYGDAPEVHCPCQWPSWHGVPATNEQSFTEPSLGHRGQGAQVGKGARCAVARITLACCMHAWRAWRGPDACMHGASWPPNHCMHAWAAGG